ncbi:ankyrin repeat protein [Colletotrichum truncatum]|uniref:Ankyrin repeat protein n=1 Tax=Colletotrichum truncatum TaxID=5467 RepID=A0ACC3YXX3_COLTU
MAPTKEFEGDEFSNNLFSDLAPLLTLFGEQVTKQFLSMSMGWADNILLAMGPLGTITIMVSAIRVGGGKRMKALVGRARESRSIAEQELLSSTSENVCELWSGRQVVRLIGDSGSMKAMLIAHDGEVFDLKKAFNKRYIETDVGVMEAYLDETLKWELETIYNAAPNLALNVGSGTASSQELHAWASLGILLQLFGIAFPGITTYYWKWDKAGSPIAGYAYICFCTGTTFLITGILLCGHVIEGVTKERTFSLTEMGAQEGLKFFSLQHRQTVGDQQFPSCVIIHSKDDNKLRTSRLSSMSYRYVANLVTVSTIITLAGYVVQFVGLRALHWSATIIQLSITVILAAIRAWVRRSLASDPMNSSAVPGYELAWLTLYVVSDRRKTTGTSKSAIERGNPQKYGYSRIREMFRQHLRGDMNIQQLNIDNTGFLWEIISGQRQDANLTDNVTYNQLTSPLRGPLKVSLEVQPKNHAPHAYHTGADKLNPLQTYLLINSSTAIRIEGDSSDAAQRSKALCAVIENSMNALSVQDTITWKQEFAPVLLGDGEQTETINLCWGFNVTDCRTGEYHLHRTRERLFSHLERQRIRSSGIPGVNSYRWKLTHPEVFQAALSLSLYTDATRTACSPSHVQENDRPTTYETFGRVVGYGKQSQLKKKLAQLNEWLDHTYYSFIMLIFKTRALSAQAWKSRKTLVDRIWECSSHRRRLSECPR